MERFGTEVVREHQNTIQVCQNNVAAQAIGEVGKHRIHDRVKSMEDEDADCEKKVQEMESYYRKKFKSMEDNMKKRLKRLNNQKLLTSTRKIVELKVSLYYHMTTKMNMYMYMYVCLYNNVTSVCVFIGC